MKKLFKKLTMTIAAVAVLAAPSVALVPAVANAQAGGNTSNISNSVCEGVLKTSGETGGDCSEQSGNTFGDLAKKIIDVFSIVIGSVSVIMIIIGGFRYIISGGSSDGVQGGKNTILYAVIGLVIVLFAQVIVRFVLTQTTS